MSINKENIFIVWTRFQRRSETLSKIYKLRVFYFYYSWENINKLYKCLAYFLKFLETSYVLFKYKPPVVFIQLAPALLLYIAAFYRFLTGNKYVSDCHNTMIYDGPYAEWPLVGVLLKRSHILIVHNYDVKRIAEKKNLPAVVLQDPLPEIAISDIFEEIDGINIIKDSYIISPCSYGGDEPIDELFKALEKVAQVKVVLTGDYRRLKPEFRNRVPANVIFTGFLKESAFNSIYANATAALVLTTREGTQPSGASEAIALNVPLIVSDIDTTRSLYKDAAIYVKNESESIENGILLAMENEKYFKDKLFKFKADFSEEIANQVKSIESVLNN